MNNIALQYSNDRKRHEMNEFVFLEIHNLLKYSVRFSVLYLQLNEHYSDQ